MVIILRAVRRSYKLNYLIIINYNTPIITQFIIPYIRHDPDANKPIKKIMGPKKNIHRKVKLVHLTLKGHLPTFKNPYALSAYERLFYCLEMGETTQQPHTHIGMELHEPRSLKAVIDDFKRFNPEGGQVDAISHKSFGTILGYHCGLGNKLPCNPRPSFIVPADFNIDDWIRSNNGHKSCAQNAKRNAAYLAEDSLTAVTTGAISLLSLKRLEENKLLYRLLQARAEGELRLKPTDISIRWHTQAYNFVFEPGIKRRHYWIWSSRASTGKTFFLHYLHDLFRSNYFTPGA